MTNKTAVWRSLHGWVMGSAQQLTEMNLWVKFNENLTNGWGNVKDTKFKCKSDDLKVLPWPWVCIAESLVLHTTSLRGTFKWSLTGSRYMEMTKHAGPIHDVETVLHTTSLRGTFKWSLMKIVQMVHEIWSKHKLKGKSHDLEVWPWS